MKNNLQITFLLLFAIFTLGVPVSLLGKIATCTHPDYPALKALYGAADGANWTNSTNWDTTGQSSCVPCTWFGIGCEGGRVTTINLRNNQLTGSIPTELGNLSMLKSLDLENNQLTGSIPTELGNLTMLNYLNLTINQLTGSIPTELGNLTMLQYLFLSNNQLTSSIPTELGNLTMLQRLYLPNNQLTGAIPTELGNLTMLKFLNLHNNQITGTIPTELGNLSALQYLYLNDNQLTGSIPTPLGNLSALLGLGLYNNQLTGTIPTELANLSMLEDLSLRNNQLTGTIPTELGNLTKLQRLGLFNNQLTGSIPTELGNLTMLEYLSSSSNQLTGDIPTELGNLTMLKYLYLKNNQFTGSIPTEFGNLTMLETLDLRNNQLTKSIPPELGNLTLLQYLFLNDNQLSGCIPSSFSIFCDNTVDISNNPSLDEQNFSAFCNTGSGDCSAVPCPPTLDLSIAPLADETFQASDNITSTTTINSPLNITYKAGQFILLNAGFEVKSGATFLAAIEDCMSPLQEKEIVAAERTNEEDNTKATSQTIDLQVFPNPFYDQSTIQFSLSQESEAQLKMYNLNGAMVKNILPFTTYSEGLHQVTLEAREFLSGIYYLVLKTKDEVQTQKVMLQR